MIFHLSRRGILLHEDRSRRKLFAADEMRELNEKEGRFSRCCPGQLKQ